MISGPFADEGSALESGLLLWQETLNAQGGIQVGNQSVEVEVVIQDGSTQEAVLAAYSSFIQRGFDLFFAPYPSVFESN